MFRLALLLIHPLRWVRALRLLAGGVRVHPSALLLGTKRQLRCARGVKLGSRVIIDPGSNGQVVMESGVWISSGVEMETHSQILIGRGTSIQRRSTVNGTVRIGRGCILAPNVFISSGTHPFREIPHLPIREQEQRLRQEDGDLVQLEQSVWVQDDCWIGTNVVICPGVTVAKGSVVGANSVVNKDVAPYSVVAGCPARAVGKRLEWNPKSSIDINLEEDHPYLLNAFFSRNDSGYVVLLSNDIDLLAALNTPLKPYSVVVDWRCASAFYWIVADRRIFQEAGSGHFSISSTDLATISKVTYCSLAVENQKNESALVEISRISIAML